MTEILLFHHAHGLTDGLRSYADELRAAGHTVHTPDLYEGQVFASLDDGVANAQQVGFGTILERGRAAAEGLPASLVYMGFSLGLMPAQSLAQNRAGALGAVLGAGFVTPSEFGGPWPAGVPAQIHMMDNDPWDEGDLDAAREAAAASDDVELFVYPGDQHLFMDSSLPSYDEAAATLFRQRVLDFLAGLG